MNMFQVVAFEPNPLNLFYLTKSALLNPNLIDAGKFTLFPYALGTEPGVFFSFLFIIFFFSFVFSN
jgi:hypothetical protein